MRISEVQVYLSTFMFLIYLVSSSIARRLVIANASTNVQTSASSSSSTIKSEKLPQIKVALYIQRYAHLSPDMNQLEKDYTNLLTQLETENSYLSDHELRHKREM
jgi:hypothetical protein